MSHHHIKFACMRYAIIVEQAVCKWKTNQTTIANTQTHTSNSEQKLQRYKSRSLQKKKILWIIVE